MYYGKKRTPLKAAWYQVYQAIKNHVDFERVKCIVIAGPGFVKDDFVKYAREEATKKGELLFLIEKTYFHSADSLMLNATKNKFVSCHCSTAYKQGLNELMSNETVKSQVNLYCIFRAHSEGFFARQVADTKAMSNVSALDRFYTMLKNDPERAVYGPGKSTTRLIIKVW